MQIAIDKTMRMYVGGDPYINWLFAEGSRTQK